MNIEEIRQKYPQYKDVSDQKLASALYDKYYKDKMEPIDFYHKIGMDWQNIGGQVVNPNEPAQATVVDESGKLNPEVLKFDMTKGVEKAWDRIGANVQAGYTGVMQLGSTLAKIADSMGLAPKGTAESAQNAYNEAEKIYQQGQYPETAASKVVGGIIPAAAATYGLLPASVGIGGALLGTAGRYLGAAVGGAISGGVTGGLMNEPGMSPTDLWNEDAATSGAVLGAALGPVSQAVSQYGKNIASYVAGKKPLEEAGYKGPILSRDFEDSSIAKVKSAWLDNVIDQGVRNEQLAEITPAIKNVLGGILNKTEAQSANQVGRVIRGVNKKLENQSDAMWSNLFNAAKEQGITKIDTTQTKQAASAFLENYGQYLSKSDSDIIGTLAKAKQVNFEILNKIKGKAIWNLSEQVGKIQGSLRERPVTKNMSEALKNMYWNITDDIGNTLKDKPELADMWEKSRAFTSGVKDLFNADNNPQLVNAINDINENTGQLKTFINSVLNPISNKASKFYNESLGPHYQKSVSDLAFRKVFDDSFNTEAKGLNLPKFFRNINEANDKGLLNNDTVKSLSGLETYFNKIQSAQLAAKEPGMSKNIGQHMPYIQGGAAVGGYALGGLPGAAGAIAALHAAPAVLAKLSRNSPLKNALVGIAKLSGKNENTVQYLMDKVGQYLTQTGAIIKQNADGLTVDLKGKPNE